MTAPGHPACRDVDPEIFFPDHTLRDHNERVTSAKSICLACPISAACLGRAVVGREKDGIWGGYTPLERRALLRDAHRLGHEVGYAVRRLELGHQYRVRPTDLLAVVHGLTSRGWSVEKLSAALDLPLQAVLKVRQRVQAATACLVAVSEAESICDGVPSGGVAEILE